MKKRLKLAGGVVAVLAAVVGAATLLPLRPSPATADEAAYEVLDRLRDGDAAAAQASLAPEAVTEETLQRERQYPIRFWWTRERTGGGGKYEFEYAVVRGYVPMPAPVWITVERQGSGWKVTQYSAAY